MAMKYLDARPNTFEDGSRYEEFVAQKICYIFGKQLHFHKSKTEQLKGENKEGVEIKFDGRMKETGNVYIETAEKSKASNKEYYPSGIFREDNSRHYWVGDYKQAFVFEKDVLREKEKEFRHVETSTSKAFLIPVKTATTICKRHFVF